MQYILLGLIQGLSEFLPVSSSAHLILIPIISEWQDQGLAIDVAAHLGTLFAVLLYFRKDIRRLFVSGITTLPWRATTQDAKLFWYLGIATIPVCIVGLLGHDFISESLRTPRVIAIATIIFGILLLWSDKLGKQSRDHKNIYFKDIMFIGCAQVLALVPGTSRSGITMTAGLMLGLNRSTAVKFSFLLSIPVIGLAGVYETYKLITGNVEADLIPFLTVMFVSWFVALLTLKIFIRFIEMTGMLPYVIYRLLLGVILLGFYY